MSKTQTNLMIEENTKKESQKILIDRGETLSEIVNSFLEDFIRENRNGTKN
jgi:antitoxin component of RelBE/YafQ-DinJ toxin-antitoxin module